MKYGDAELPRTRTEMSLTVRLATDADTPCWDSFVESCPDATFFHRAAWKGVIQDAFGHRPFYLLAERAGGIVGVLPLVEVRSLLFGHSLVSLPFCVYGGVAATEPSAVSALHAEARQIAARLRVGHLELRNRIAPGAELATTGSVRDVPQADPSRCRGEHARYPAQAAGDDSQGNEARPSKRGQTGPSIASSVSTLTTYTGTARRRLQALLRAAAARIRARRRNPDRYGRSRDARIKRLHVLLPRRSAAVLRWRRCRRARAGGQRLQVLGTPAPRMRARVPHLRLRPKQTRHRARSTSRRTGVSNRRRSLTSTCSSLETGFPRTIR